MLREIVASRDAMRKAGEIVGKREPITIPEESQKAERNALAKRAEQYQRYVKALEAHRQLVGKYRTALNGQFLASELKTREVLKQIADRGREYRRTRFGEQPMHPNEVQKIRERIGLGDADMELFDYPEKVLARLHEQDEKAEKPDAEIAETREAMKALELTMTAELQKLEAARVPNSVSPKPSSKLMALLKEYEKELEQHEKLVSTALLRVAKKD